MVEYVPWIIHTIYVSCKQLQWIYKKSNHQSTQLCGNLDTLFIVGFRNVHSLFSLGSVHTCMHDRGQRAPDLSLNQCWFLANEVLSHASGSNSTACAWAVLCYEFANYTLKITATSPNGQWSNNDSFRVFVGALASNSISEIAWQYSR